MKKLITKYSLVYLMGIAFYISCAKPTVEPVQTESTRLEELQENQFKLLEQAFPLLDRYGWLVSESCDSMLWTGKFGTATNGIGIHAAEKPNTGKFYRTPAQTCFEDGRSGSSFSRDMAEGLLAYLISQGDLETIERHISFGEENGWIMGEGARSRTIYSPALISLWYKAAKHLGHDYGYVIIPNEYSIGKIDYQAHLQMMDIYINGEIDGKITDVMLARIIEHSDRIPSSTFYAALRAKFSDNLDGAIALCLDDSHTIGDYVRCDGEPCELAERIFACGIITKHLEERSNDE